MKVIEIIGICFAILFALIFYFSVVDMIQNISKYFIAKRKKEDMLVQKETNPEFPDERLLLPEKMEVSVALINTINIMINSEISRLISVLKRMNIKYDVSKLDEDTNKIAKSVYDGLKKDSLFLSGNIIFTDEYLMNWITSETIIRLMENVFTYNQSIRIMQQ
jgi:hypothetical protein